MVRPGCLRWWMVWSGCGDAGYNKIMDDNDRSALVQQRIKKMLESKKKTNR